MESWRDRRIKRKAIRRAQKAQRAREAQEAQLVSRKLISTMVAAGLAFACAGTALAAWQSPFARGNDECTWGISAIVVADGHVVAGPDVAGCVP
jgi:hypothetical protein